MLRAPCPLLLAIAACGPIASTSPTGDTTTGPADTSTSNTATGTTASSDDTQPTSAPSVTTTPDSESSATTVMLFLEPDHPDTWCDVFAQDCPAGQKCNFFSENLGHPPTRVLDQRCVPLAPNPVPPDELCHFNEPGVGLDDCAAGSFCMPYYSDGAGTSVCVSICGGSLNQPTCPEHHSCVIPEGGLFWCAFNCDDLLQDCAEGLTCTLGSCQFNSRGTFDRPPGAACNSISDCVPKATCVPAKFVPDCPDEQCCTELCDLQAKPPCALPGQSCQSLPDELGYVWLPETTGMCLPL